MAIPVFIAFARSGGTYANRVLGSHPELAVLSEVNPAFSVRSLAWQGREWLGLVPNQAAEQELARKSFGAQVRILSKDAAAKGRRLVLRDWVTVNFLPGAWNGLSAPSSRLETVHYLRRAGLEHCAAVIVREARATYRSMVRNIPGFAELSLEEFATCYRNYANAVAHLPKIQLEDFRAAPLETWNRLSKLLDLRFDASALERYQEFDQCTGDNTLPPRNYMDEAALLERSERACLHLDKANELLGFR